MIKHIYLILAIWLFCIPFSAQDDDVTEGMIGFGQTVTDTITDRSFFDQWRFQGRAGDLIAVQMIASDGLAPLIGILDAGGELVARSDMTEDGPLDALPDAAVELLYRIPSDAQYIIVATRAGNENGSTTGSYDLSLLRLEGLSAGGTGMADVTFRCGQTIVTNAAMFRFPISPNSDDYRISVYGIDDFQPHLRITAGMPGSGDEFTDCSDDGQAMTGDQVIFPFDDDTLTLTSDDLQQGAQFSLRGSGLQGWIEATIASPQRANGQYMVVVEGMRLSKNEDALAIEVRFGPLAKNTDLLVYMVADAGNRIDPLMYIEQIGQELVLCDDAGRRGCEDVPEIVGYGVLFNDGTQAVGDRFDAGLKLNADHTEWIRLNMESRARDAYGEFVLVMIGQLPSSQE